MGSRPTVNRHDRLLFGGKGLLAPGESSRGHVVLHHDALLQLVPDRVRMIGVGCFEKLLEVISGLPHLALKIVFGSGDELLIGVASILIVITFVTAGGDHNSLEPPLRPPLVASGAPLCTLIGWLSQRPPTPRLLLGAAFPLLYTKMALIASSPVACMVAMSWISFVVFG
jgi:hypothetical protein